MKDNLEKIPSFVEKLKEIQETIIANIVFVGQIPSPTFHERQRAEMFMERLSGPWIDECTTDGYQNPIGIIRGTFSEKPPIFIVAHLDTFIGKDVDHNFTVQKKTISGPGILDNSVGVGVMASLPEIFHKLNLRFESDIVLAGVIQSIGIGNLRGIRHLLKTWKGPIRGAVCIEGGELGRLNYTSDGMKRCEIYCSTSPTGESEHRFKTNAILIMHEVITQILQLHLPQRPRSRVIIGKISGGFKHGMIAYDAKLCFEIQSDSDNMVKTIFNDIQDIVDGISHESRVELDLKVISTITPARLKYNHPLVKSTVAIMEKLNLKPASNPSESELSMFLSRRIPAVTLGITHGENYHLENAQMEIEPMFTGIAQIIGVMMSIDSGVCDEH
jgi:tripeptide aminopeptidase